MAISRTAIPPEERFAALHAAEQALMESHALIPIAYYADFYLVSDAVTDWWHSPDGTWHFEFADLP